MCSGKGLPSVSGEFLKFLIDDKIKIVLFSSKIKSVMPLICSLSKIHIKHQKIWQALKQKQICVKTFLA